MAVFDQPLPAAMYLKNPVAIPRGEAVRLAHLEEEALWRRSIGASPGCRYHWRKAAEAAKEVQRNLRRGDDLAALQNMYGVSNHWQNAARCERIPTRRYPMGAADGGIPWGIWAAVAGIAAVAFLMR
jgi:hypothetical protein